MVVWNCTQNRLVCRACKLATGDTIYFVAKCLHLCLRIPQKDIDPPRHNTKQQHWAKTEPGNKKVALCFGKNWISNVLQSKSPQNSESILNTSFFKSKESVFKIRFTSGFLASNTSKWWKTSTKAKSNAITKGSEMSNVAKVADGTHLVHLVHRVHLVHLIILTYSSSPTGACLSTISWTFLASSRITIIKFGTLGALRTVHAFWANTFLMFHVTNIAAWTDACATCVMGHLWGTLEDQVMGAVAEEIHQCRSREWFPIHFGKDIRHSKVSTQRSIGRFVDKTRRYQHILSLNWKLNLRLADEIYVYVMSWWLSPYTFIIFYPPKTRNKQLQPVKVSRFPSPSKSANEAQAAASFLLLGSKKLRNTTWNLSMKVEVFQATWKNQTWSCKKCNLKSNHEKWHLKKVTPEKHRKKRKLEKSENCKEYVFEKNNTCKNNLKKRNLKKSET